MFKDGLKIWLVVILFVVLTSIVLSLVGYVGKFTDTVVERKVFENSYQYSQGKKEEIALLDAQIAQLENKLLNPNIDVDTKRNIQNQLNSLKAQRNAARIMYNNTILK